MDDDPRSVRNPEGKKKPCDKSNTLLYMFARNLGCAARALKIGSTVASSWLLGKSGSATPKATNEVGKGVRNLEFEKKALAPKEEAPAVAEEKIVAPGIIADVEAAVKVAEEDAAEEVSAGVEAAVKAAEEDAAEEVSAGVEAAVKAAEEDAAEEVSAGVEAAVKAAEEASEE
jgi:hypothetical protein